MYLISKQESLWPRLFALCLVSLFVDPSFASELKEPCEYHLTKNVSDGKLIDGMWYHESVHYPSDTLGTYNYVLNANNVKVPTKPHLRGCFCLLRTCLQTCCHPGEYVNFANGEGNGSCRAGDGYNQALWPIGVSDQEEVDLLKEFYWSVSRPNCKLHFLEPDIVHTDKWYLLKVNSFA